MCGSNSSRERGKRVEFFTDTIVQSSLYSLKEASRRSRKDTSSSNEISKDQLESRLVVRGGGVTPPALPLSTAGFWTDV
jgi:hypothetical protein